MDPISLYRLLRRRWIVLVVGAALGATIGYASTLFVDDAPEGPVTLYWEASQVLVFAGGDFDFSRAGSEIALGAVPATVAEARGVEPADLGIRSVTDGGAGTITITAVSAGDSAAAAEAREISLAVAQAYVDSLLAEDLAAYREQVAALGAEIAEQDELFTESDDRLRELRRRADALAEGETLSAAQQDDLERASARRAEAEAAGAAARVALEDLVSQGEPEAPVELVQEVAPSAISGAEYRGRIAQAERAQNFFNNPTTVSPAAEDPSTSQRLESPILRALLGIILGTASAILGVVAHARLDTRLRTRAAFEAAFDLPVIAEVPVMKRSERRDNILHSIAQPYSHIAEAHRYIRSVLLFARSVPEPGQPAAAMPSADDDSHDVRVIMVTSANPSEGKTTTAANLAVMMAEAGYDTVLMNCDHRRPRMHELFGVPYAPGTVTTTSLPDLHLVTDVRRDDNESPAKLGERQRTVVRNARQDADVVILDTAPILATNDALDLLSVTDLVIIVAREGVTSIASAAEARELLVERMGMPVAGVVVTGASTGFGDRYYERSRYGAYYDAAGATAPQIDAPAANALPAQPDPTIEATSRTGTIFGTAPGAIPAAPEPDPSYPVPGTGMTPTAADPESATEPTPIADTRRRKRQIPTPAPAPDLGVAAVDADEPTWMADLTRTVDRLQAANAPAEQSNATVVDLRSGAIAEDSGPASPKQRTRKR